MVSGGKEVFVGLALIWGFGIEIEDFDWGKVSFTGLFWTLIWEVWGEETLITPLEWLSFIVLTSLIGGIIEILTVFEAILTSSLVFGFLAMDFLYPSGVFKTICSKIKQDLLILDWKGPLSNICLNMSFWISVLPMVNNFMGIERLH